MCPSKNLNTNDKTSYHNKQLKISQKCFLILPFYSPKISIELIYVFEEQGAESAHWPASLGKAVA